MSNNAFIQAILEAGLDEIPIFSVASREEVLDKKSLLEELIANELIAIRCDKTNAYLTVESALLRKEGSAEFYDVVLEQTEKTLPYLNVLWTCDQNA